MTKAFLKRNLRRLVLLAPCFAAVGACDRPSYTYSDDVPVKGVGASSSFSGTITAGVASTTGGGPQVDECPFNRTASGSPVLVGQAVGNQAAGRTEVYAELTDAEALALKQGGSLIPPPPSPSTTASPLVVLLRQASANATQLPARKQLLDALITRFAATRSTWPNPWALRLVDHAGSEHMNPLRIVFKPEAWIVKITDASPVVVDVKNQAVAPEMALQSPERIAAIYYRSDALGSVTAGLQCEVTKRELALGNEAMVESFSLGTKEILARLNSDIDALNAFFTFARSCTNFNNGISPTFHSMVACTTWGFDDHTTEFNAYAWSLATPVELYKPTPTNLASLISALEADRFMVDPFVGTPPPPLGAGGEGGAAGAPVGGAPDLPQGGTGGTGGTGGSGGL